MIHSVFSFHSFNFIQRELFQFVGKFVSNKRFNKHNIVNWDQFKKLPCYVNVTNAALLTRKYSKHFN